MSAGIDESRCDQAPLASAYAIQALPPDERHAFEAHLAACAHCRQELADLRPVLDAFDAWPTDVLRPVAPLQEHLARRIAADTGAQPVVPPRQWREPDWDQVAPGISCKLLANDDERHMVSMLVRLAPGAAYPPHTHAGVEELHLLEGELWIDGRKLYPGDYNRGEPGAGDKLVWSETGCTCVLITSTRDTLA